MADKSHIHHKLMRVGLSQRKALIVILLMALFYISLNLLLLEFISNTEVFIIDILIYILFNVIINKKIVKND